MKTICSLSLEDRRKGKLCRSMDCDECNRWRVALQDTHNLVYCKKCGNVFSRPANRPDMDICDCINEEEVEVRLGFRKELEQLINRYSIENKSNTNDFVLANYIIDCLDAYSKAKIHNDMLRSKAGVNEVDLAHELACTRIGVEE